MREPPFTTEQLRSLFDEIAALADQADRVCYNVNIFESDPDVHMLTIDVLREHLQRVGWLADRGAIATGGKALRGDADEWLLSPAWNDLPDQAKGVHHAE